MPVSLRLPPLVEEQIAEYAVRQGLSKSAVIVRSVNEFLAAHARPSAYGLYLDVMQEDAVPPAKRGLTEIRPRKLALREALQRKHAQRSVRARGALMAGDAPDAGNLATAAGRTKPRRAARKKS